MSSSPPPEARASMFDDPATKANENEIASYRAISPLAVLSAIFGAGSVLCVLDLVWLFVPALALIFGLLALRKIRKYPEIATGQPYAQAGIGLALVCSLGAITYTQVFQFLINREMTTFSRSFVEALNQKDLKKANRLMVAPAYLKGAPESEIDRIASNMVKEVPRIEETYQSAASMIAALSEPGRRVEFDGLQATQFAELVAQGRGRLRVVPGGHYAEIFLRSSPGARGRRSYYVEVLRYPVTEEGKPIVLPPGAPRPVPPATPVTKSAGPA